VLEVKVIDELTIAMDQLSPWQRSLEEIGFQYGMKSPALKMCDQQSFMESYFMATSLYTIAEFNVFNGWERIRFIEAAHRMKDFRPNRPTGAPKGRGFFVPCLMRIVMEQIFVL
jgi:hypothetical protein